MQCWWVKSLGIDCVPGEWTEADTELLEYICNENNRYFEIVPKK